MDLFSQNFQEKLTIVHLIDEESNQLVIMSQISIKKQHDHWNK